MIENGLLVASSSEQDVVVLPEATTIRVLFSTIDETVGEFISLDVASGLITLQPDQTYSIEAKSNLPEGETSSCSMFIAIEDGSFISMPVSIGETVTSRLNVSSDPININIVIFNETGETNLFPSKLLNSVLTIKTV